MIVERFGCGKTPPAWESSVCSEDNPCDKVRDRDLRRRRNMMTVNGKNVAIFTANEHDRIMILTCPRILTAQDYS